VWHSNKCDWFGTRGALNQCQPTQTPALSLKYLVLVASLTLALFKNRRQSPCWRPLLTPKTFLLCIRGALNESWRTHTRTHTFKYPTTSMQIYTTKKWTTQFVLIKTEDVKSNNITKQTICLCCLQCASHFANNGFICSVLFHLWKRNSVNGCQEPGEVALLAAGVEVLSQCVVRQPTFHSLFEPHIAIFTCVEVSLKYRVLLGNVACPMDPAVAVNVAEKNWACCSFHCHWLREQPSDVLFVKFCWHKPQLRNALPVGNKHGWLDLLRGTYSNGNDLKHTTLDKQAKHTQRRRNTTRQRIKRGHEHNLHKKGNWTLLYGCHAPIFLSPQ